MIEKMLQIFLHVNRFFRKKFKLIRSKTKVFFIRFKIIIRSCYFSYYVLQTISLNIRNCRKRTVVFAGVI